MLLGRDHIKPQQNSLLPTNLEQITRRAFQIPSNDRDRERNMGNNNNNKFRRYPNKKTSNVIFLTVGLLCLIFVIRSILPPVGQHYQTGRKIIGLDYREIVAKSPYLIPDLDKYEGLKTNPLATVETNQPVSQLVPPHMSPTIVLVTDLDYELYSEKHLRTVVKNRKDYAQKHGYGLFCQWVTDYKFEFQDSLDYKNWGKIATMRAAMHSFPHAKYFFFVGSNTVIKNDKIKIENDILNTPKLDAMMLREAPVLRNSDIIKTIRSVQGKDVQLIMAQDEVGMNPSTFVMENCQTNHALLDHWTDLQYRTYQNFEVTKNTYESITHVLQWHHTFLKKFAMIPTKKMASLLETSEPALKYTDGDFVAVLPCTTSDPAKCESLFSNHAA